MSAVPTRAPRAAVSGGIPLPDSASGVLVGGQGGTTAVIRARFEDDRPNDAQGISTAKAWSNGRAHHGSRLALDRDANLFITVGGPSKLVRMEPVPRG